MPGQWGQLHTGPEADMFENMFIIQLHQLSSTTHYVNEMKPHRRNKERMNIYFLLSLFPSRVSSQ